MAAGIPIKGAVISPALEATRRGETLKGALIAAGVKLEKLDDRALTDLADTEHPQGVVAVIEPRDWSLDDITLAPRSAVLVLDAVQDPGNVGTMLRTALALGAAGVVALPGTADLLNPKAMRGGMGASFRLPCVATDVEALAAWAATHGAAIWVTAADGDPVPRAPRTTAMLLVVGNEGAGVGESMTAHAVPSRGHSPGPWRRVAQRSGGSRDSSLRGLACRLKDWAPTSSTSWPASSASSSAVS